MFYKELRTLTDVVSHLLARMNEEDKKAFHAKENASQIWTSILEYMPYTSWGMPESSFVKYMRSEFGIGLAGDIAFMVMRMLRAEILEEFENPYDLAKECKNFCDQKGIDPLSGKKVLWI